MRDCLVCKNVILSLFVILHYACVLFVCIGDAFVALFYECVRAFVCMCGSAFAVLFYECDVCLHPSIHTHIHTYIHTCKYTSILIHAKQVRAHISSPPSDRVWLAFHEEPLFDVTADTEIGMLRVCYACMSL